MNTQPETAPSPERQRAQRAALAVGLAPPLVLLGFTAVVSGFIDPGVGLAVFVVCAAWVAHEMYRYQDVIELPANDTGDRVT